jgi:hypothetical protein
MRFSKLWPIFVPFLLSLPLAVSQICHSEAAPGTAFIVSATEGYGVEDCLGEGGECGHIVADAWCEAHGHGAAISFGRAEDITGAITLAASGDKPQAPYVITCAE